MPSSVQETLKPFQSKLFPGFADNHFSSTIGKGIALVEKYPAILNLIRADQTADAIRKKESRLRDENWLSDHSHCEFFETCEPREPPVVELDPRGRKRMPPTVVFLFFLVRGYLGSIKDKKCHSFIQESKFLETVLFQQGEYRIPAASTILDNLNCLSENTLIAFHHLTINEALVLGLDDFKKLYFDSTRISADSAWPTESRTIADLLARARRGFEILREYGIKVNLPSNTDELLRAIQSHKTSIALNSGKKGSKKHIKKMYKKILKECKKLVAFFGKAVKRAQSKVGDLLPSLKEGLEVLIESIEVDLHNVELCAQNARSRVLKSQKVSAEQKVLGIADPDAEMIPKGMRPPVFGYKPQIGRSEKGFIVGVLVPQGCASDAGQMKPITDEAIKNTTVTPDVISYDDGYTNSKVREEYLKGGVGVVSFSGAKGKAQLGDEWDLPEYKEARNRRSMAESTMSILKGFFDLGRFTRRGRENVTQEILTASIFHNIALLYRLQK